MHYHKGNLTRLPATIAASLILFDPTPKMGPIKWPLMSIKSSASQIFWMFLEGSEAGKVLELAYMPSSSLEPTKLRLLWWNILTPNDLEEFCWLKYYTKVELIPRDLWLVLLPPKKPWMIVESFGWLHVIWHNLLDDWNLCQQLRRGT